MATKEYNLDSVFYTMGDMGKFEILQFVAIALVMFPTSNQLFANVFTCSQVPHQCAAPPNSSDLLFGLESFGRNLTISYQECDITVSVNKTVLRKTECLYGMEYELGKDASAVSQFDLVCGRASLASLSQTLVIAGQGAGAAVSSVLSDRFGRKPVMVFSNFGLLITGLIIAFSPTYAVFATFKFLVGCFQQGAITCFYTAFVEMLTIKKRRRQALWSGLVWGCAMLTMALMAYLMANYSWRYLQLTISLTSLSAFLQLWYVWESLRWLTANGKTKKTLAYLRYGSKLNKVNVEEVIRTYESCATVKSVCKTGEPKKRLMLLDLLKSQRLFVNAIVMWYAWLTIALAFFAIYLTSTSLAGNKYLNFSLTAFMEIPATIMLYLFLNRYGRKFTLIFCLATTTVGLIASGIFKSFEPTGVNNALTLVFSLVAMVGASGAFNTLFFYTPEIFPTNMRVQAVGVSSLMGRIGGMIAPFTGILSDLAKWGPGVLIGCSSFIITILIMFLPETKGRDLPQTVEDVINWSKKDKKEKEIMSEMNGVNGINGESKDNTSSLLENKV